MRALLTTASVRAAVLAIVALLAAPSGRAEGDAPSQARAGSPDSGPFQYVSESDDPKSFQPADGAAFPVLGVYTYKDVIAVAVTHDENGADAPEGPGGVRIYDAKTKKKKGESKAGLFEGYRGDDGLFVLSASTPAGRTTTYVNASGKTVRTIPRDCRSFFEKRASCRVWGVGRGWLEHYVDESGKEIMPPRYWMTERFRDGEAHVAFHPPPAPERSETELWHTLIDKNGKPRFRDAYRELTAFREDRAWVVAADDPTHRGFIDRKGALVAVVGADEEADTFVSGVAVVRGPKGERVMDKNGKTVLRLPLPFRIYGAFAGMRARLVGDVRSGSAIVSLDGSVTDVPELWTARPTWPAQLGKPPITPARPRDMNYQTLEQTTKRSPDPTVCADAAASMIAISKSADPEAWVAAERCARLGGDEARAADAHTAFLYVSGLDPGVARTRAAWATAGGRIPSH